jgi:hypothetical protein
MVFIPIGCIIFLNLILVVLALKSIFDLGKTESMSPETRIEDFEDTEVKFHDMKFSDTDCHLSEPSEQ